MKSDQDMIVSEAELIEQAESFVEAMKGGGCPFCGHEPYEYVDVGVGGRGIPVAVTCCDHGIGLYQHGDEGLSRASGKISEATYIVERLLALRPKEAGQAVASGAAVEEALARLWDSMPAGEMPSYPQTLAAIKSASPPPASPAVTVGVKPEWRCFHCDEVFTDEYSARLHFGADETQTPACQIKGAEGGLVEALRRAEKDAGDAWFAIHNETTDAAKAYYAQSARHSEQLRRIEEVGYERGLRDAKAHPETLGLALTSPPGETAQVEATDDITVRLDNLAQSLAGEYPPHTLMDLAEAASLITTLRLSAKESPEQLREAVIEAATLLLECLDDFESELDGDDTYREYGGHVAPAKSRLRAALKETGK